MEEGQCVWNNPPAWPRAHPPNAPIGIFRDLCLLSVMLMLPRVQATTKIHLRELVPRMANLADDGVKMRKAGEWPQKGFAFVSPFVRTQKPNVPIPIFTFPPARQPSKRQQTVLRFVLENGFCGCVVVVFDFGRQRNNGRRRWPIHNG